MIDFPPFLRLREVFFAKTPRKVSESHMLCVYITDNGRQLLYNQSIIIGLLYLLSEIMQIARKMALVKKKRDKWDDRI